MLKWQFEWDWEAAEREFNRAVALAPSYSCAHESHASFIAFLDRRGDSLAEIATIDQLDSGFSSASVLREQFCSVLGTSPLGYRRSFTPPAYVPPEKT